MRVAVRLHASLSRYAPAPAGGWIEVEAPEGADVAWVAKAAGVPEGVETVAVVSGEVVPPSRVVSEGERVSLFPPLGGG